jgi:hypothetical protein
MFALVGSVLAALGHHVAAENATAGNAMTDNAMAQNAMAEVAVPWRLVIVFALGQFALVWPLARRRLSLPTVIASTLLAQGVLHLALTRAGGAHHPGPGRAVHAAGAMGVGDGHAWHHASAPMTTAHVAAALAVAWLLHHADAAMAAALVTARAVGRIAATVAARLVPRLCTAAPVLPSAVRLTGCLELPEPARVRTLHHTLVRRGPPGHAPAPVRPFPRAAAAACPVSPARSSPCRRTALPPSRAASRSPAPPP